MNNLQKRILTSIITFPLFIFFIIQGGHFLLSFLFIVFLAANYELFSIFNRKIIILFLDLILILSLFSIYALRGDESNFYLLRVQTSFILLLWVIILCVCSDVGGYVFGKNIGGKKLTKISPNKTRSGSIGSFIFSIFPIIIINLLNIEHIQIELNFINILFSLFISLICQLGDLFFSYFKRLNNKKNTGILLPGHGGLLDRIDGLIIVLPIVYLIKIFGIY